MRGSMIGRDDRSVNGRRRLWRVLLDGFGYEGKQNVVKIGYVNDQVHVAYWLELGLVSLALLLLMKRQVWLPVREEQAEHECPTRQPRVCHHRLKA